MRKFGRVLAKGKTASAITLPTANGAKARRDFLPAGIPVRRASLSEERAFIEVVPLPRTFRYWCSPGRGEKNWEG